MSNECAHGFNPGNCSECIEDKAFDDVYGLQSAEFPYQDKVEAAKRWLGKSYLCYEPINARTQ
jgi:hypothetical protein